MRGDSVVSIGLLLPDVLGTYGDAGNATVLQRRLSWRSIRAMTIPITLDSPVPESLDIYVLGGGEDAAQTVAARHLINQPGFHRAAARGAIVFAVCAGLQLLGNWFATEDGRREPGLGMLDLTTAAGPKRAIGEIVSRPTVAGLTEPLTGFENHGGRTSLGPDAVPLGDVIRGTGNDDIVDGAIHDHVVGTYLHGPALARNPQLADWLLGQAVGLSLPPLDLEPVRELRRQRLSHMDVTL